MRLSAPVPDCAACQERQDVSCRAGDHAEPGHERAGIDSQDDRPPADGVRRPSPMERRKFFLIDVEVRVDVLDVVVLFERFHQLQQLFGFLARSP